ncbi:hypothetical protein ACHAWT_010072, partial [Skeletonema menzelii]
QERPYHSDSTASRLLSEVKHCRARLVLRWGTTLESLVLFFCSFPPFCFSFHPLSFCLRKRIEQRVDTTTPTICFVKTFYKTFSV